MSAPTTTETAWKMVAFPKILIAQTSQEILDAMHLEEMQRLDNGGKYPEPFSDFMAYVLLPMFLCLAVIFIGRRLSS
jgi:hypothetical protein